MIGGGEGNSLGLRKSSTRMVALIITNFNGCIGSSYKCLSEMGIFFHLADSSIDWARRKGKDLKIAIKVGKRPKCLYRDWGKKYREESWTSIGNDK